MHDDKNSVSGHLSGVIFLVVLRAILFGSAGRWDLPFYWAYLGVWAATMVIAMLVVDPSLVAERMRPGPGGTDYATAIVLTPLMVAQYVVAGVDVGRYHFSDQVPLPVQLIGLLAMAGTCAVLVWAEAVNRFFSTVIRIQTERGHHVITTGPYRYLRHPGYASSPFLFIGGGLALGSWSAALIGLILFLAILVRTAREDRFLHEHLEGYTEYAKKVRYRLFPGLW